MIDAGKITTGWQKYVELPPPKVHTTDLSKCADLFVIYHSLAFTPISRQWAAFQFIAVKTSNSDQGVVD